MTHTRNADQVAFNNHERRRPQLRQKAREADREAQLAQERDEFHAAQRATVRARPPWRLPEPRR